MNHEVSTVCSECGKPLPGPGAPCAACLLGAGLETDGDAELGSGFLDYLDHGGTVLRSLDGFELLELLGEGGMGRVYKARQMSLNRIVALKLMRTDRGPTAELRQRFRREAELAARLQHPNIVPIFEVGGHDREPYYAMEWVPGSDLGAVIGRSPLEPSRVAGYLRDVALATHFAHEKGVLHRDLKPSNILVGHDDRPRITDFGLARAMEVESGLTLTGDPLGTPGYLPPEQISAGRGDIGRTADVYGLGAILYHALTGGPPFTAPSVPAVLRLIEETPPVPPRKRRPAVPRDLETICLKCLEKEPARRYPTAEALARDLDRYLHDEPILARPPRVPERVWRWMHRHRRIAVPVSILSAALAITVSILVLRDRAHTVVSTLDQAAEMFGRNPHASLRMLAGVVAAKPGHRIAAEQLINRLRHSAFLVREGPTMSSNVVWATYAARDTRILLWSTNAGARRIEVWDAGGHLLHTVPEESRAYHATLSSNASRLAVGADDGCTLHDLASGATPPVRLNGCPPEVIQVAFLTGLDPGAETLLTASSASAMLWDPVTGQRQRSMDLGGDSIFVVAISKDGRRMAAVGAERFELAVWDLATGKELLRGTHRSLIRRLEFSPDGHRVLAASDDGTAVVWNLSTGRTEIQVRHPDREIRWGLFLGDGSRFCTLDNAGQAIVWSGHASTMTWSLDPAVAFDWGTALFSGSLLTTVAGDNRPRLWDLGTGRTAGSGPGSLELYPVLPPDRVPNATADGGRILAVLANQTAAQLRWIRATGVQRVPIDTSPPPPRPTRALPQRGLKPHVEGNAAAHAFSPDDTTLAVTYSSGQLVLFDAGNLQVMARETGDGKLRNSVDFSPDGRRIAVSTSEGRVQVFDWNPSARTLRPLLETRLESGLVGVEFSADNRFLRASFTSAAQDALVSVAAVTGPVPKWLPELAEALAGESEEPVAVGGPSVPSRFDRIRRKVLDLPSPGRDPGGRELQDWAQRLVE